MHQQLFYNSPTAIIPFGMKQFVWLAAICLLCHLDVRSAICSKNLKIHQDNLWVFESLQKDIIKIQAAMKKFAQQGKRKEAQEAADDI
jgi:hypothetical protein